MNFSQIAVAFGRDLPDHVTALGSSVPTNERIEIQPDDLSLYLCLRRRIFFQPALQFGTECVRFVFQWVPATLPFLERRRRIQVLSQPIWDVPVIESLDETAARLDVVLRIVRLHLKRARCSHK